MAEEHGSGDLIYVRERRLPYPTFDADNHMYENRDALTKFIPKEFDGIIKYVDIDGRTKLAIKDQISDYIPNPTFTGWRCPEATAATQHAGWQGTNIGTGQKRKPRIMPGSTRSSTPSRASR